VSFGELLRRHRRRAGLSQENLSERIGMSVTGIRNLESGRTRTPRASTVRMLAEAFALAGHEREAFFAAAAAPARDGTRREPEDRPGGRGGHRRTAAPDWPVPAQLPPGVPGFTGRAAALRALDDLCGPDPAGAVAVVGTAGVGKTALAVHWAHAARDRFPDGQLFADLHGFDAAGTTPPEEVARTFLEALAVPAGRIPADLAARSGLLRSLLADRRVLVVLDDARDADQVRPLLPGTPGCLAVVTSRRRLTGLVATGDARPLPLDVLAPAEARDLLGGRLGGDRLAAEPAAVDAVVARCAGLPLALTVVAARAALHPGLPLAAIVDELDASRGGLDAFSDDDPAADVRSVLSWSYRALDDDAARLFRLLALHPGPDVAPAAAASLAGIGAPAARAILGQLTDAHLLSRAGSGRYAAHDLLRAYATELVRDGDDDLRAATGRLLDHYLHTGYAAALLLTPGRERLALEPPADGVTTTPLHSHDDAMAWFAAEEETLPGLVTTAAAGGFDAQAWRLAYAATYYFQRRGRWTTLVRTGTTALAAARRAGDVRGQVHAHSGLAHAFIWLQQLDEARDHAKRADALCHGSDDVTLQAHTALDLAFLFDKQGAHEDALQYARRAHALFHVARDRHGTALGLNQVAWCQAQLGDFAAAAGAAREAVAHFEELRNVAAEANAWDTLGYAEHGLGRPGRAGPS